MRDDQPIRITHEEDLDEVSLAIEDAGYVALDTESNSLHVYREQVCWIQIEADDRIFIIDTLEVRDLERIRPELEDPRILTILHGADYDVSCMGRDFDIRFGGLFDTMVAAKFLGYEQLGLAALVEKHFGVELDKSMTRHDWGRRPLEERYVRYLVDDVIYLRELREILQAELEEEDLTEEAEIEFRRVARLRWSRKEADPDAFRRIKGSNRLDHTGLAILKELHALREELAENADRPPFKVLGNPQLLQISARRPRSIRDLDAIHGLTPRVTDRFGRRLLNAVKHGIERRDEIPLKMANKGTRPPEKEVAIGEGLRQWRKEEAEARGRVTTVILPNPVLEEIAREAPTTFDALEEIEDLGPKRCRLYGDAILAITRNPQPVKNPRRGRRS